MKTLTATPDGPPTSQFDAIRRTRPDGSEYWGARDMQPLMGYSRWDKLKTPLERAMATAKNQGLNIDREFSQVSQVTHSGNLGDQVREDYELTRVAAYLLAMNGNPSKPEVAAAQMYFALRTREAESGQAAQFVIPTTFADALALAARQAAELEETRTEVAELEATNAKLSPRARVADQYEANPGVTPTVFHKMHLTGVSEREFFEHLYRKDYLIDQRNSRWDERNEEWKDGPEHGHPAAKGKRYFYLAPKLDRRGVRRQQTLVIPGDAEHDLVAALERDGLPSRNRPALPGSQVVHLPRARRPLGGAR